MKDAFQETVKPITLGKVFGAAFGAEQEKAWGSVTLGLYTQRVDGTPRAMIAVHARGGAGPNQGLGDVWLGMREAEFDEFLALVSRAASARKQYLATGELPAPWEE